MYVWEACSPALCCNCLSPYTVYPSGSGGRLGLGQSWAAWAEPLTEVTVDESPPPLIHLDVALWGHARVLLAQAQDLYDGLERVCAVGRVREV